MIAPWPTRWYLKRHALHRVLLVVELVEAQKRGYCHYVTSRPHARRMLHQLRPMVEAIMARDIANQVVRVGDTVFDVVEREEGHA